MTNVPGPGFLVVLTAFVSAGLVMIAGVVAVFAHALTDRPFWQSMAGAYVGVGLVVAFAVVSQWGLTSTGRGILTMGAVGYLAAGLLFYAVLASPGLVLARVLFDGVRWDDAAYYATVGWLAGQLAGLTVVLLVGPRTFAGVLTGGGLSVLGSVAGGPLAAKRLHDSEQQRQRTVSDTEVDGRGPEKSDSDAPRRDGSDRQ